MGVTIPPRVQDCLGIADNRTQICTLDEGGGGPCRGDSGGPLLCSHDDSGSIAQVGIISSGDTLCEGTAPSFYTRVEPYQNWLKGGVQNIGGTSICYLVFSVIFAIFW